MRIVVVGGGFGGVTLAQHLERGAGEDTDVVLISSQNHLVFSPMLAETVGRSVSALHIVVPGRLLLHRARWVTASVSSIDRERNVVEYMSAGGEHGTIEYDHLVLACGSVVNLNGIPGLAAHAFPLKSLGDAVALGNELIGRLEEAAVESDDLQRRRLLTVVVIGGGFSGVEVAGEINDLMVRAKRFYPELSKEAVKVVVLHRGDRILPELSSDKLSEFARRKLCARGLDVRLHTEAAEVSATNVRLKDGSVVEAATVVSTIGNATNPVVESLSIALEKGRLKTDPDMRVTGTKNLWAIGDCAAIPNAWDSKPSPATAQFATRQAKQLAGNLRRVIAGQTTRPFRYRPLGMLASIGHQNAVAEILGMKISGFPAWFLWRGIYLAKLPTLSRKIEVAIDWAWLIFFPPNLVELRMERTRGAMSAHYAAGEFVYHKDEPGDRFYVVQSGQAAVYLDEKDRPVARLQPGDHFGEGALQEARGKHGVSVKAETPLDLLTLSRDEFTRLTSSLAVLRKDVERQVSNGRGYQRFLELLQRDKRLQELKVRDVMNSPAITLDPQTSLADAVRMFDGGKPGYPVVDADGSLLGYCGRGDLYDAMRVLSRPETRVQDFMRKQGPSIPDSAPLSEAVLVLMRDQIEVVPVVAEGANRVVGVLSPIDIFRRVVFTHELAQR